jgi:hypothetical protein
VCWIDQLSWQAISVSGLREITEMGHVFSAILWELPWTRMPLIVRRNRKIGVSTINCVLIAIGSYAESLATPVPPHTTTFRVEPTPSENEF